MDLENSHTLTGRQLRTSWRDQEEEYNSESAQYTKRNITLFEYLTSVAHAGYSVIVRTRSSEASGELCEIGTDYFSVASSTDESVSSFVFHQSGPANFEIDILERTSRAKIVAFHRVEKSFRALLDETSQNNENMTVETSLGNLHEGTIELMADSVTVTSPAGDNHAQALVHSGTTIVPIAAIISTTYTV